MNYKTRQRWFALSSLVITFLLIKVFQDDFTLAIKSDRPLEAGLQSVRYSFAKWNYYLTDWLCQQETNVTRNYDGDDLVSVRASIQGSTYTYGYKDSQGKLVIPPVLDFAYQTEERYPLSGYVVSKFNGRWGIIRQSGEVVVPFIYEDLEYEENNNDYITATKNDRQGIIDISGEVIIPLEYDRVSFFINPASKNSYKGEEYITAEEDNHKQIIDLENNIVVPFKADKILAKTPDITLVEVEEIVGFVDRQQFTPLTVNKDGDYLSNGIAIVHSADKYNSSERYKNSYCVVDRQGKILVPARTESSVENTRINKLCRKIVTGKRPPVLTKNSKQEFGKLYRVLINDKYGYINSESELVIAPQFDFVEDIAGDFDIVKTGSLTGIITPKGRYIPLLTKENGEYQVNEVTLVGYPGNYFDHYCIIDRTGNLLLSAAKYRSSRPKKYEKIDNICKNLVGIEVNNELIEDPIYPAKNEEPPFDSYFKENLLIANINGKYGYINRQGKLAFPQLFDQASYFSEGLAAVRIGDRFGFIDSSGAMVLPSKDYLPFSKYTSREKCQKYGYFGSLSTFEKGLAVVSKIDDINNKSVNCEAIDKAKYYYLNKNGRIIAGDLIYSSFFEAEEVLADIIQTTIRVKNSDGNGYHYRYGRMRTDGEILIEHRLKLPNINYR